MPFPSQIGRWGRGLARLFGLQGQVPITLLEDVAPMLAIGVIDPFLLSEFAWGADLNQPNVAGQFAFLQLGNPPDSGVIFKVDKLYSAAAPTVAVGILPVTGPLVSSQFPRGLDSRVGNFGPGSPGSVGRVAVGTNGVAQLNTGVESSARIPGLQGFPLSYVLTPGFRLVVEATIVNVGISATFHWREVPLAPQELVP